MVYFQNYGRDIRVDRNFFWNSHLRNNSVSEFEDGMTLRSNAVVSLLRLVIFENAFGGNTEFALRRNGDNVIGSTLPDVHTFTVVGGQLGVFETGFRFNYSKGDLICFKFNEGSGPFLNMDYRMSCRIEFLKPPAFPPVP